MAIKSKLISVLVLLLIPSIAWAWSGQVVGIADGDSITVLRDKTQVKIRLYGIDCPERRQAFGNKAKQFTSKMVFRKTVDIKAGNGCQYALYPRLYKDIEVSSNMGDVTCLKCKKYIEKRNLKYRGDFPEAPTFKPVRRGEFALFHCPVCGCRASHGWGSGHRVSHCECWENGYYLDCSVL